MTDDSRDLELLGSLERESREENEESATRRGEEAIDNEFARNETHLNVECSVKSHLEMSIRVRSECPKEGLLEDGHGEGVGEDHESVGSVAERLHLEETDLIEASSVDVDSVSVGRSSLGKSVVALRGK